MAKLTIAIVKEQSVRLPPDGTVPGDLRGNGKDAHAPIGPGTGDHLWRDFMKPEDLTAGVWSGVYRITKAELVLEASEVHVARGATPRVGIQPMGAPFNTGGGAEGNWNAGAPTPWVDGLTGNEHLSDVLPHAGGQKARIDVTWYLDRIAPEGVLLSDGSAAAPEVNHGFRLVASDEAALARTWECYSIRSAVTSRRPYIELTYDDNFPPLAPLIELPEEGSAGFPTVSASPTGDRLRVKGRHQDPTSEPPSAVMVEVRESSATDADPGAGTLLHVYQAAISTDAFDIELGGTLPSLGGGVADPLEVRSAATFRARTIDAAGKVGAWTSLDAGHFVTAYLPAVPQNPYVDATTVVPHAFGSIDSADPADFILAARWVVYDDSLPTGSQAIHDSGREEVPGSPARFDLTYGGDDLEDGRTYRYRLQLWNRDDVASDETGDLFFTVHIPVGPTIEVDGEDATTSTKVDDTTPDIVLTDALFDGYELEVYRLNGQPRKVVEAVPDGAPLMWDVPLTATGAVTSKTVTYAGTTLVGGTVYHVRGRTRPSGSSQIGPWSPLYPWYLNALPDPPTVTFPGAAEQEVGSWVVPIATGTTPPGDGDAVIPIRAPFSDRDHARYADAATKKRTTVRVADTPAGSGADLTGSPLEITSSITDDEGWSADVVMDDWYDVRVEHADSSGAYGSPSAWQRVKASEVPVLTLEAPGTDPEVLERVEDPTPRLDYGYSSPTAKPQRAHRLRIYRIGPG